MARGRYGQGSVFRKTYTDRHGEKQTSSVWTIAYYVRGSDGKLRKKRESSGTTVKKEAIALLNKRLEEARNGKHAAVKGGERFSSLLASYETEELPNKAKSTQKSYRNVFNIFRTYFCGQLDDPKVSDVRAVHVRGFLTWRGSYRVGQKGGISKHTLAHDLRVLKLLFTYAIQKEYIDADPTAGVKAPKADPRTPPILTEDQFESLLSECEHNPMLWLYVLLLGETGVRAYSEALELRWEDVQDGFIHVRSAPERRTKSGKSRYVPMTPRLASAMQEHALRFRMAMYGGKRSPFIFHHTVTRQGVAGEQVRSFREAFAGAAKRAKLPKGFRAHDLRHRRVTTWLADGASPVLVKEAVGHASLQTTMGYTHLVKEHLRPLVEAPAGKRAAQ